jgi:dTDP-4-amino-4,6-dideoxygalactose transaminase
MLGMLRRDGLRLLARAVPPPRQALAASYTPSRMSGLDARLVHLQLGRLREVLARRAEHAGVLAAALDGAAALGVPGRPGNNVWTKFTVVAASAPEALHIRTRLSRAGVETEDMYTPLHLRDFGRAYARGSLPVTERLAPSAFNLPVRPQLDGAQVAYVGAQLRRALRLT